MAYLTALLPMAQAVAAYANLKKSAQTDIATGEAEGRSQNQIAADILVERLTGQDAAAAVPTEVHLIMQDSSLFGPGEESAWFPGVGPIPAKAARNIIAENEAATFIRRLYTRPEDGQLVRMDSRRREFSGLLRRMVVFRDDVCRSPWCEAPIKHADHAESAASGGETDWDNSSGLCAACNYLKELGGWRHKATADDLEVITPTGHHYKTRTKPLGPPDSKRVSDQEEHVGRERGPDRQHGPEPGERHDESLVEATAGPPGNRARAAPLSADPEFSVMIPWRYIRRKSQPATIDIGGSTIGIDIFDADERPMSPTEEQLCAAILEHRGKR